MLPFLNKKKITTLMVKDAPGELAAPKEEMSSPSDDLVYAADDLIQAIKEGSAEKVAQALRAAIEICGQETYEDEEKTEAIDR